jgi:hypothetical protein
VAGEGIETYKLPIERSFAALAQSSTTAKYLITALLTNEVRASNVRYPAVRRRTRLEVAEVELGVVRHQRVRAETTASCANFTADPMYGS